MWFDIATVAASQRRSKSIDELMFMYTNLLAYSHFSRYVGGLFIAFRIVDTRRWGSKEEEEKQKKHITY